MNALAIIGCSVGVGIVGFLGGAILGFREGGDINLAPAFYAPIGAVIGGFVGVVIGALVFA